MSREDVVPQDLLWTTHTPVEHMTPEEIEELTADHLIIDDEFEYEQPIITPVIENHHPLPPPPLMMTP